MIFPEINYDMVEQMHGMDITFVTTAQKDDHALALLHQLGMPFRGDDKPVTPEGGAAGGSGLTALTSDEQPDGQDQQARTQRPAP